MAVDSEIHLILFMHCSNVAINYFQGRKIEEQRSQRLSAELSQLRHEFERRIAEKDEEIEAIR